MAEEFDPEDWLKRLEAAGGHLWLDAVTMFGGENLTPEVRAIWDEIRGPGTEARWRAAEALARETVGPVSFPHQLF